MTATATDPVVAARGVRVRYDTAEEWVGPGADLEVLPGEVVLLLGPSGCGKSTLSLTLNGLVPHSAPAELEGTVLVEGNDTATHTPGQLCTTVGMVFQDPDSQVVCPTLLDEVCFGLENLLVPLEEVEPRAMAALRAVGLAGRPGQELRDPVALSGGGRQRLALAAALALEPRVLVLDEPTANLDPVGAAELYGVLARVVAKGTAVVLVEHNLDDVVHLVDRVVVLDAEGAVRLRGTPPEVFGGHARTVADLGVARPTAVEVAERLGLAGGPALTLDALADRLRENGPDPGGPEPAGAVGPPSRSGGRPLLTVAGLDTVLGGERILHGVDLVLPEGDFLAVAGVNGAGKSTLARSLAGVLTPPPAAVTIEGRDAAALTPRELSELVGFVFQNPEHQFVAATVFDELAHGLRLRGTDEGETADRVREMLDRFDLAPYRETNPFLLSHGEKRRLSVGTALIFRPRLLVLDEPTFGQDRARAGELLELLDRLHEQGTTVVVVSHDLQLVADHAHTLLLLREGRVLAHGPTGELLNDDGLLIEAGLRPPPVRRLAAALSPHRPAWAGVHRLDQVGKAHR